MEKGYHLTKIPRGVLGEYSKVEEELAEYEDAKAQGSKIMMAVELSDLLGALQAYLHNGKWVPSGINNVNAVTAYIHREVLKLNLTIEDLIAFAAITERAFKSGERSERKELE